ncbi:MAG: CDP-alcohol phosphatidyltransferase family protein [candidate division Zixibacteria bacterium]|nr:CDP-alcohol phosphatidyltransferase family protein [candidate division Zixibacteria bacterium]
MLGSSKVKTWYVNLLEPVTRTSVRFGIHPNALTVLGFGITLLSAVLYGMGAFRWAGLVLFIGGSCDVLDGHLARVTGTKSVFGALLDSTLDRYAEIAIFIGIAIFYLYRAPENPFNEVWVLTAILGLTGSLMVSYVRARAEGLGQECTVGFMQRPERVVCLGLGALLGEFYIPAALVLIAAVSNVTAASRLYYIWKRSNTV